MKHLIVSGQCIYVALRKNQLAIMRHKNDVLHTFDRVGLELESLIIDAPLGGPGPDAAVWMNNAGIAWSWLCRDDGEIMSGKRRPNAEYLYAQLDYRAAGHLGVTRMIFAAKLDGQAAVCEQLGLPGHAKRIRAQADQLPRAETHDQLRTTEAGAARIYWSAWARTVTVPFTEADLDMVPERWRAFRQRHSLKRKSSSGTDRNRHATDPVNALLNLAYDCGETLIRRALLVVGLYPLIGFSHNREYIRSRDGIIPRDDAVFDLLEAIRPDIDAIVLHRYLLRDPWLKWTDFIEVGPVALRAHPDWNTLPPGTVRVDSPVIRYQLLADIRQLQDKAVAVAEEVRDRLIAGRTVQRATRKTIQQ